MFLLENSSFKQEKPHRLVDLFPIQINGTTIMLQITTSFNEVIFQMLVAIISALLGFLFALFSIVISEKHKRKNTILRSSQSLLKSLQDIESLIRDNRKKPVLILSSNVKTHQEFFTYYGLTIPISAFDSLLFSGAFREFDIAEQGEISNFYDELKLANELSWRIFEFITIGKMDSEQYKRTMIMHGSMLDDKYDLIEDKIDSLRQLLEKKRRHSWLAKGNTA